MITSVIQCEEGMWRVVVDRLRNGEQIASISAILLFVLTFFHWFGVKAVNTSNLLFAIQSIAPGKSAWEALEYIPIVLVITVLATLAVPVLRLTSAVFPFPVNAPVALLGLVSVLLIAFRIVEPPTFRIERTVTWEGVVQLPIVLALLAAAGITLGGLLAMREEGFSLSDLRARRHRDQKPSRRKGRPSSSDATD